MLRTGGWLIHVKRTDRQEIKVCATEKRRELIKSRGKGGNPIILSFLRPFSRSKRYRPGVSMDLRVPSLCVTLGL